MNDKMMLGSKILKVVTLIFVVFFVASCTRNQGNAEIENQSIDQLYAEAFSYVKTTDIQEAYDRFKVIAGDHMYSFRAKDAEIMVMFLGYVLKKYEDTIVEADRFIRLNPLHRDIDYVYYIRAISYTALVSKPSRDQFMSMRSKDALEQLSIRFPKSKYSEYSKLKIKELEDTKAISDVLIGKFYLYIESYPAAIKRFLDVLQDYPGNSYTPEVYLRIAESYYFLGIEDMSKIYFTRLTQEYPEFEYNTVVQFE